MIQRTVPALVATFVLTCGLWASTVIQVNFQGNGRHK